MTFTCPQPDVLPSTLVQMLPVRTGGALPRAESLTSEPTLAGLTSFLAAAMADSRGRSYPPLGSYLRASSEGRLPSSG